MGLIPDRLRNRNEESPPEFKYSKRPSLSYLLQSKEEMTDRALSETRTTADDAPVERPGVTVDADERSELDVTDSTQSYEEAVSLSHEDGDFEVSDNAVIAEGYPVDSGEYKHHEPNGAVHTSRSSSRRFASRYGRKR